MDGADAADDAVFGGEFEGEIVGGAVVGHGDVGAFAVAGEAFDGDGVLGGDPHGHDIADKGGGVGLGAVDGDDGAVWDGGGHGLALASDVVGAFGVWAPGAVDDGGAFDFVFADDVARAAGGDALEQGQDVELVRLFADAGFDGFVEVGPFAAGTQGDFDVAPGLLGAGVARSLSCDDPLHARAEGSGEGGEVSGGGVGAAGFVEADGALGDAGGLGEAGDGEAAVEARLAQPGTALKADVCFGGHGGYSKKGQRGREGPQGQRGRRGRAENEGGEEGRRRRGNHEGHEEDEARNRRGRESGGLVRGRGARGSCLLTLE